MTKLNSCFSKQYIYTILGWTSVFNSRNNIYTILCSVFIPRNTIIYIYTQLSFIRLRARVTNGECDTPLSLSLSSTTLLKNQEVGLQAAASFVCDWGHMYTLNTIVYFLLCVYVLVVGYIQ